MFDPFNDGFSHNEYPTPIEPEAGRPKSSQSLVGARSEAGQHSPLAVAGEASVAINLRAIRLAQADCSGGTQFGPNARRAEGAARSRSQASTSRL
jgi:hypothetical protein